MNRYTGKSFRNDAKIEPRQDRSNADPKFARNRIRHKILPELERINPQAKAALARLAETPRS